MNAEYAYAGQELDLFAEATRWKSYFSSRIRPYLGRRVLEVGAGLGGTTRVLCSGAQDRWVCLEPDPALAGRLRQSVQAGRLPACCEGIVGTLEALPKSPAFDTVLYTDVLEHIEDDRGEVRQAAARLAAGGHLVVLSPAHPWLYTPFDKAIGHYRRYTRRSLAALTPPELEIVRLIYLDAAGMLASLGNRLLLRRSMPSARQVAVWDRCLVPLSRILDRLLFHSVGKSVLGVWRKRGTP